VTTAVELLIPLLLAAGFAAVGETVLLRRSTGLAGWNASLVTGLGVCAAVLFPFSILAPHSALRGILYVMGVAVVIAIVRRTRRRARPSETGGLTRDPAALLLLLLAAAGGLAFAGLDLRYNFLWDGFAIWASKAQRLYVEGALTPAWYTGVTYDARYVSYPPAVPLCEALVGVLRARFDFEGVKPLFLIFYASMVASTYSAVRAAASDRLAAAAAAMVVFVPALSTRWAAGAYADMPLAAVVAAVAAAALRRDEGALPWLIGALTTVKPEGLVLASLAAAGAALVLVVGPRPVRLTPVARGAAVVGGFVLARLAYVRWVAVRDDVYVFESIRLSASRLPTVARLCLREMLNVRAWGLLWPAFFAATALLLRRGEPREKALAAAAAAGAVVLAVPFLFTTWPVELHVEQAYFRLLAQLAPAAVVAAALAYSRAREAAAAGAPAARAALES